MRADNKEALEEKFVTRMEKQRKFQASVQEAKLLEAAKEKGTPPAGSKKAGVASTSVAAAVDDLLRDDTEDEAELEEEEEEDKGRSGEVTLQSSLR